MPKLDLNFGSVGAVPPEGVYYLEVKKAIVSQNKKQDGNNVVLDLELVNPDDAQFEGFDFRTWISLKDEALWSAQNAFEAITGDEWREDDMALNVVGDPHDPTGEKPLTDKKGNEYWEVPDFVGARVYAILTNGEYNGRPTIQVDRWIGQSMEGYNPDGSERQL